jgi:apolipoprotein N-acyltransferase
MQDRSVSIGKRVALTALSAASLAFAMRCEIAILGVVALVPWLLALARARLGEAVALGAWLGLLYGGLLASWVPNALQTLGSPAWNSYAGFLSACAVAGPPEFVGLAVVARLTASLPAGARALALAIGVLAIERWLFVPWGLLGYSQIGSLGVAQLAAVGGVPLISALLVAFQVALAEGAMHLAIALGAAWLALALAGLPVAEAARPIETGGRTVDLLLVQPNLPRAERWNDVLQPLNLHRVESFTDRAVAAHPGTAAVVLPENLLTARIDTSPELAAALAQWVDALGVPVLSGLVLSATSHASDLYRSSVVWLEPGRGVTARIDKERAIPLLESSRIVPGDALFKGLFGAAAAVPKVEEAALSGPMRGPIPITPILCYEVLFPDVTASRRTPDSVAIVNLADDSWVAGDTATRHLTNVARFRAIEQRLGLIRVAHGGLSAAADEFGRLTETLPRHEYAARGVRVRAQPPRSASERIAIAMLPLAAFSAARAVCSGPAISSKSLQNCASPRL